MFSQIILYLIYWYISLHGIVVWKGIERFGVCIMKKYFSRMYALCLSLVFVLLVCSIVVAWVTPASVCSNLVFMVSYSVAMIASLMVLSTQELYYKRVLHVIKQNPNCNVRYADVEEFAQHILGNTKNGFSECFDYVDYFLFGSSGVLLTGNEILIPRSVSEANIVFAMFKRSKHAMGQSAINTVKL